MGLIRKDRTPAELNAEFERLYLENKKEVFDLVWWLTGDEEAAKDIGQKAFLTLHRKLDKVLNHPNPKGWIIRTVHYYVKHYKREMAYRLEHEEPIELAEQVAAPQSSNELATFLDSLPKWLSDIDKDMLVLRFFYGYTLREIATKLGFTHGAARNRMARLLKKLQEHGLDEFN